MKTTKQVIDCGRIPARLVRAVIRQTGKENLRDIAEHGADQGFKGFTYTRETVDFFKRNRASIVELAEQEADSMGENPAEMVAGFQCLAGRDLKRSQGYGLEADQAATRENKRKLAEFMPSVCRCLYGGRLTEEDEVVANALAWFAAEEVARAFED